MNKVISAIVYVVFVSSCWFVAQILKLPSMVQAVQKGRALPAFTRLCMGLGPFTLVGLALLGAGYCVWIWTRKAEDRVAWVGFLATAVAALGLVMLPTVVAIYLPLVQALNEVASK